jgi:hypothetical protein
MDEVEIIILNEISHALKVKHYMFLLICAKMRVIIIIIGYECKRGTVFGVNRSGEGER